jgi:solute carrier family 10 (sodium/bile acid cotransporter), member 7
MSALTRVRPDEFTTAMLATVMLAFLLPCRGTSAGIFVGLAAAAIGLLFFFKAHGCRARRSLGGDALAAAFGHFAATFVLFPVVGLALRLLSGTLLPPPPLYLGLLFLCTLPSTVQGSVAFWRLERFRM